MKKLFLLLSLLVLAFLLSAQQKLNPVALNIFKNGSYFIVREGKIEVKDQQARISLPSGPLLATYWFTPGKSEETRQLLYGSGNHQRNNDHSQLSAGKDQDANTKKH